MNAGVVAGTIVTMQVTTTDGEAPVALTSKRMQVTKDKATAYTEVLRLKAVLESKVEHVDIPVVVQEVSVERYTVGNVEVAHGV